MFSRQKLKMVDQAENYLTDLGFNYIRARHKGKSVNIEVDPGQVSQLLETTTREKVENYMRSIGYDEITIDPEGYRQGKLNEKVLGE